MFDKQLFISEAEKNMSESSGEIFNVEANYLLA